MDEALRAISYPHVQAVQIIFNMFRLKPVEAFFATAAERHVGIRARVPLASGLLTGKFTTMTQFAPNNHRNYNRSGKAFDQGETFSGIEYETDLQAVEELRQLAPEGATLAQLALHWILMFPEVTTAIPGAKTPAQAEGNVQATLLSALDNTTMSRVQDIYDRLIRPQVHHRW